MYVRAHIANQQEWNRERCACAWGSENLFIAVHANAQLVVYDKEKEDAPFIPGHHYCREQRMSNSQSMQVF